MGLAFRDLCPPEKYSTRGVSITRPLEMLDALQQIKLEVCEMKYDARILSKHDLARLLGRPPRAIEALVRKRHIFEPKKLGDVDLGAQPD